MGAHLYTACNAHAKVLELRLDLHACQPANVENPYKLHVSLMKLVPMSISVHFNNPETLNWHSWKVRASESDEIIDDILRAMFQGTHCYTIYIMELVL